VMCYSEHRFRLSLSSNVSIGEACRNDIVLAETMIKARFFDEIDKIPIDVPNYQLIWLLKEIFVKPERIKKEDDIEQ
nr:hypothetical protein [Desulfobacteraceae bacterium]